MTWDTRSPAQRDAVARAVELGFHRGVLSALAVVALHDAETIYREIVESVGEKRIVDAIEGEGDAELYGLVKYGYVKP